MAGNSLPDAKTRKLQQVGGGTYTVSVPKEWATEQSLSAGDTVRIYPDGDGSLVVCRDVDGLATATATLDGEASVEDVLRAAYTAGVERLTLTATDGVDGELRRRIEGFARARAGARVVETTDQSVAVAVALDDAEVSVPRTVVRLQFVALSVFRTAVDAALDGAGADERIEDRRAEAGRLAALVTRQFGRSLSDPAAAATIAADRPAAFDCYRTAAALDRVADRAAALATTDADGPAVAADSLRSLADATRRYLEAATTAVVDAEPVDSLTERRAAVSAAAEDAATAVGDDPVAERRRRLLGDCADCGDRIAAVAREAAVRRDGAPE